VTKLAAFSDNSSRLVTLAVLIHRPDVSQTLGVFGLPESLRIVLFLEVSNGSSKSNTTASKELAAAFAEVGCPAKIPERVE
jgi:hypothetical protein